MLVIVVDIDVLSEEEKTGNLVKIHKRKNQLIRPMASNVDQALVIFSVHEPEPNFHLLNRFLITMEQQEIPVIICFNKTDLSTEQQQEQLRKDYENSGCIVVFQAAAKWRGDYPGRRASARKDNHYGRTLRSRKVIYFKLHQQGQADGDRRSQ